MGITMTLAGAAVLVALLLVAMFVRRGLRRRAAERRTLEATLARSHEETALLRERVDALSTQLKRADRAAPGETGYLITDAGTAVEPAPGARVPDRVVLSATIGGPLVKVAALAHGVRRALSAESRNRIWFEMRREVRASRRRRRRALKEYTRQARAAERAGDTG